MTTDAYKPDSTEKPSKKGSGDDESLLSVMRSRLNTAISATSETRLNQTDDVKFAAGSSDNNWQWPDTVQATRLADGDSISARPMLTVNKLPQHIKQVTNDQRMNRPAGKVVAANGDASTEVAEILDGIVSHVEYISDADIVYDTACDNQVTHGEGYWRVLTDYADEDSFDLEIFLRRIRDSFSVYLDPMIQDPCGADADWGMILQDMTHEEFEVQFPKATPISSITDWGTGNAPLSTWITDKIVRIAEYFYVEMSAEKLYLFADGKTAFEGTPEEEVYREHLGDPIKERISQRRKICWIKTNGFEVLDRRDWPGKYIPIVLVLGNEFVVEGRIYRSGIVRNAKDPQRMYNYWVSQEAEMLALAPKAPFIGAGGQFEGYEEQWRTANTKAHPYLEYNSDVTDGEGRVLPPPQRAMPPMAQTGLIAAKQGASEDIKDATGQYNASLGQTSNERSGKAILARQHEGDVSTYHYGGNLGRSIRHSTRIIVDLIPKVYDTERIARIIGEDGKEDMVKIDPKQPNPVHHIKDEKTNTIIEKIYNPSVGKYDVRIISGPGYATKRKEALDAMAELLQGNPQLWAVAGDLFVKNMDWPGAQELAKRFAKTIDPKLMSDDDESPELQQAKQQLEEVIQQYHKAMGMLQNVKNSVEAKELDLKYLEMKLKADEVQIKQYEAETKRMVAMQPAFDVKQMQDIAAGTVHAAMATGDLTQVPQIDLPSQDAQQGAPGMPQAPQAPQPPMQAPEAPQQPAPGGV